MALSPRRLALAFSLCALTALTTPPHVHAQHYTTAPLTGLPGNVFYGSDDGTAQTARFSIPYYLTVDRAGNVFVADSGNATIRKITPAGFVTTFVGYPHRGGTADGIGSAASLSSAHGLAIDADDNLYLVEGGNGAIRKITPAAVVTTILPGGTLTFPHAIARDARGMLYVTDGDALIRQVTPQGVVSPFAGSTRGYADGPAATAQFDGPSGLAFDPAGNLIVVDHNSSVIRKITPAGIVSTVAGLAYAYGSLDGTGGAARFSNPGGVTIDRAGFIYIADEYNYTLRKITPAGVVTTLAGTPRQLGYRDGAAATAQFNDPSALAFDPAGNLYITDTQNGAIRKLSPEGIVSTLAGAGPLFNTPSGIAIDPSGRIYVADRGYQIVRRLGDQFPFTLSGLGGVAGSADGAPGIAQLNQPTGLALDRTGNLYFADTGNHTIRKVTPNGLTTTLAGFAGASGSTDGLGSAARFSSPLALALDASGNVFVADTDNHLIRKITSAGLVTTVAGVGGVSGSSDGPGNVARFFRPRGISLDADGSLYVADTGNSTIRKISAAGLVSTFAGLAGTIGSADGPGASARFNHPAGVAVDRQGIIFVTDTDSHTLRRISPNGTVLTLAGLVGSAGAVPGSGPTARMNLPTALTTDAAGNVYLVDSENFILLQGVPTARLVNLSARANVGPDANALFVGFSTPPVSSISPVTPGKSLVVRGVAQGLTQFGVDGVLPALQVKIFEAGGVLLFSPGPQLGLPQSRFYTTALLAAGAFFVSFAGPDVTLFPSRTSGNFTAQVDSSTGASGIALAEIYDLDPSLALNRLVNLSARAEVGAGADVLIAGFVIAGNGAKTVLLRGIGPSLAQFGVARTLAALQLTLFAADGRVIATNRAWAGTTALRDAFLQVGAFPLSENSADAALLVTLPPGAFTVQVAGTATTTGIALVEIYEVL